MAIETRSKAAHVHHHVCLVYTSGNAGYFEYSECLAERVDSHQVEQEGNLYKISERGARNCEIVESSLPMTVRQKMEKNIKPVADELRRRAMITASHETADNVCRVHLALSDGMGEILNLQDVYKRQVTASLHALRKSYERG